jgi:hypothetical protein
MSFFERERKGDYRGRNEREKEGGRKTSGGRGGGESPDGRCGESRNVEVVERT